MKHFRTLPLTLLLLSACTKEPSATGGAAPATARTYTWKMVTTWPKNFPGLGTAPERFAEAVKAMSGGRLTIKVYGAGELVPALEVLDAVSGGTAAMGHGAAYYWKGKAPEAQFFAAVPFGLNARETDAWLRYGGGLELWRELYAQFGLIPFPGGNTGVQMGGWFNQEITSLADVKGLKMRIPGLGGDVFERAGGVPVLLPGGEIFTALQTGAIDATEWVGPYNDLAFGLHEAAEYYYTPGWHEPATALEFIVNREAFEALPEDLQAIVRHGTEAAAASMLHEYTARNAEAFERLKREHGVEVRQFPPEVLARFRELSEEVLAEQAESSPLAQRIYDSYTAFRDRSRPYQVATESAYDAAR